MSEDLRKLMPLVGVGQHGSFSDEFGIDDRVERLSLVEYGRAIAMRKWTIAALFALACLIAWLVVRSITPMYRSTATVLIEPSAAKVVSIEGVFSGANPSREYFLTQVEQVRSTAVLTRVSRSLALARHPEFDPRQRPVPAWRRVLTATLPAADAWLPAAAPPLSDAMAEAMTVRRMAERLTVEPVRMSQLLRISFEASDPKLAADIANGVAAAFIRSGLETQRSVTRDASDSITEPLADLKARLDASEASLQAYREREGMLDGKTTALGGTGRQLEDLIQKLVEARVRRSELEETFNLVRKAGADLDALPAVVRNPGVQRAREVEAEAERTFAEIAQRAGPAHPKYAAAETELALARANTRRLVQTIVSSVEKEFTAARATEKSIEAAIAQARGQIQSMNRKEIELGALEREVSTNRQVYQTFLSRLRETTAAKELEVANARVTDPALPATNPVRPRSALIVGASGAVGAALGVLLAIVLRRFDNRVNTSRDVEDRLGQRLLAALPKVRLTDRSVMSRLVLDSPHTPFAEAIRTAGTAILLDSPQSAKQALVVTSALPGEGKSTFATNFALWQARTQKVLLVEADLRRPSIPTALAVPSEQKGLVEYLNGSASLNDCIMTSQHTSLHLMVCGRVPQNPLELLVSSRFKDAVARLRDMYDLIVFNAPPVQVVADALAIGAQATGMIFVVKAGDTPISLCRRAIRRTGAATVPILGVVLNQLDYEKAERYYGDDTGFGRYESYATVIRSPDGR